MSPFPPGKAPRRLPRSSFGPRRAEAPPVGQPPLPDAELQRTVDRSLVHGVAWTAVLKLAAQTVAWSATLVVARLLTAADYGIYGLAMLWLGVVQMLTEFGIGTAVVTRPALSERDVAELNTVSVLLGAAGTLLTCALAPLAARAFHQPDVVRVVLALSVTLVVGSLRSVPWALLQRALRFKRLAVYESAQTVALAALSVTLAAAGFRYWTLVVAAIASSVVSTGITLARHRAGFARPDWRRLRGVLVFSRDVVVTRVAWYAYTNVDFAVASRMLGAVAAGYYGLAWSLAHLVVDKVAQVVYQVTPGALARVQHDTDLLRRYFLQITAAMTTVFWPLTIGLAVIAPDFVPVVLGARWAPAMFPLVVLSAYSSVWIVLGLAGQVLLVIDEVAFARRNNIQQLVALTGAFVVGARWGGVNGIALGWLLVHPVLAVARVWRVLRRLEIAPARFAREALLPAAAGCGAMALAVAALRATLLAPVPPAWRVAGGVAAGALTYLAVQATCFRPRLDAALAALRDLRRSGAAARAAATRETAARESAARTAAAPALSLDSA